MKNQKQMNISCGKLFRARENSCTISILNLYEFFDSYGNSSVDYRRWSAFASDMAKTFHATKSGHVCWKVGRSFCPVSPGSSIDFLVVFTEPDRELI